MQKLICVLTKELKVPWWKKLLRFLNLIKKPEKVPFDLYGEYFKVGDILQFSDCETITVIEIK